MEPTAARVTRRGLFLDDSHRRATSNNNNNNMQRTSTSLCTSLTSTRSTNNNSNSSTRTRAGRTTMTSLVAFALVAIIIIGSVMVECASSLQDYEYMDLKDLYDMMQQNAMRPKKSPRAEKGQPLRMRFGRRSDPWLLPSIPIKPNDASNNILAAPFYYGVDSQV